MPASRPLSPHLQVYKWQITMVLSISHRATGLALSMGTLLLVWWLVALATGPQAFAVAQGFVGSWLGRLLLLGWTFSLFFHLANGKIFLTDFFIQAYLRHRIFNANNRAGMRHANRFFFDGVLYLRRKLQQS